MLAENWENEKLYFDGDLFFAELLVELEKAETSIDLEFYIFKHGLLSERVRKSLIQKSSSGLAVRLLLDGFGSFGYPKNLLDAMKFSGVKVETYHPVSSIVPFWPKVWTGWASLNHRNHRKVVILDGRTAFVGGMNIDDCHLREVMGSQAWRDSGIRVQGSGVDLLKQSFALAFGETTLAKNNLNQISALVRLNDSWKNRRAYRKEINRLILNSQNRVYITTPYFNPPLSMILALRSASKRGIDVRLLLPSKSDHWTTKWFNRFYYAYLLRAGVKIFEYTKTTLHAKTQMIDDWASVGSCNKNHRSFYYDLEVDIVLSSKKSLEALYSQWQIDLEQSISIFARTWSQRFFLNRVMERSLRLLRRWF